MARIKLIDKVFETSITETQIQEHVKAVADRINKDMADKNPLLLAVLNGSFMFAADLMRMLTIPAKYRSLSWHRTKAQHQREQSKR